jgi:hypothetical protein
MIQLTKNGDMRQTPMVHRYDILFNPMMNDPTDLAEATKTKQKYVLKL